MATIIGLTGRKQAGKDTSAAFLIEQFGFKRLAFADAVKDIIEICNPAITVRVNESGQPELIHVKDLLAEGKTLDEIKVQYETYRNFMTALATDSVRKYDPDFWVKIVLNQMDDPAGKYVITDVRFPNEAAGLRGRTGDSVQLWYVQSDRAEATPPQHESEYWAGKLNEEDALHNNGSVRELHAQIDRLVQEYGLIPEYAA